MQIYRKMFGPHQRGVLLDKILRELWLKHYT